MNTSLEICWIVPVFMNFSNPPCSLLSAGTGCSALWDDRHLKWSKQTREDWSCKWLHYPANIQVWIRIKNFNIHSVVTSWVWLTQQNMRTCGCNMLTSRCKMLLCGDNMLTCWWKMLTCGDKMLTCEWKMLKCGWKMITSGWKMLTRGCKMLTSECKMLICWCKMLTWKVHY